MSSLKDLPGLSGQQKQENNYDFDGFDDIGDEESNQDNKSKYFNAEKFLNDFDNEQREGFKVEVKRPVTRGKGQATNANSGKKKAFVDKFGQNQSLDQEEDEEIEEDIQTEREPQSIYDNKIESSLGHQAGITVSQSLGIDPSVDSLALDEYDHIEVVEV